MTQTRAEINKKVRETRIWYQSHRICPKCRKNDLLGDEKVCLECNAKAYEITMRSRKKLGKEYYNSQHAEWTRNEHQRRIEQGICVRCGKRKADTGYKTCGMCREKDRIRWRMKNKNPNRGERYKQGLCYFCDNPIKEGQRVCEEHYRMNLEKLDNEKRRQATEKIKNNNNKFFWGKSWIETQEKY